MGSDLPDQLGRYRIIRRLGTGGMAEVFLAKSTGAEGIEKILVVKRVLPSFARSHKFISMFVDEAKVAMRLNHPNIVQVYAFEQIKRDYILAMEFVDGLDLGRLVSAARRKSKRLPYALCAYLVQEVAKGLDYAHRRKDASGVPMDIVHRDVSPQNVLLTYDGIVKVADFGIAKARMVSEETGVIKGKFAYMSPEQARGERVDQRSDVYSLGVLLAELLMNRAMYPGQSGLDVLEKVRDGQLTLPQEVDPHVPRPLQRIVRRATAADREERYQSARSMANVLTQYLHLEDQLWTAEELEGFIAEVAPRVRTSPETREARAVQTFAGGATVFSDVGAREVRERRRVVVVAGRVRGEGDDEATLSEEAVKVLDDVSYKADAVLSWPDGPGQGRFRFIVGLGKASVNDPLKATRIATDTIEALEGLSADALVTMSASLGMSRGMVSTVRDLTGRLLRYAPVGNVLEVAEKLAEAGDRDQILVAGDVYRLIRRDFAFDEEEVREVDVRTEHGSVPRSIKAWALRGARTQEEREADLDLGQVSLIGRREEVETVRRLYDEAVEASRTQFVAVVGDLGVGKTALVRGALESLDVPPTILRCESGYGSVDVPYSAVTQLLRSAAGVGEEATAAQACTAIEALIAKAVDDPAARRELGRAVRPL
ncbi:MAG TPA: protein kinase, partial [Polyangiaceae bacterium LLY-WYZ-15_(1-7)]|nr:protein kinase [Polyangiaceae bacterium LLY-WYZ-15_(1-7)]HJL24240.1 protein kinase [Polyangiaceae bacterium LLY-WYZ-15_(1-7)]